METSGWSLREICPADDTTEAVLTYNDGRFTISITGADPEVDDREQELKRGYLDILNSDDSEKEIEP
ncbi:hypothetical protein MaudCBS49596_003711 [Microsporum audouinii]